MSSPASNNEITREVLPYTAQQVTYTSPKAFKEVIAALEEELNAAGAGVNVMKLLATARNREEIEKGMSEMTDNGKRDFVYVFFPHTTPSHCTLFCVSPF